MADRSPMDGPWDCVLRVGGRSPRTGPPTSAACGSRPPRGGGAGEALTELRGALPDQAALLEVVRTLHALGVPLRSVTCTPRRRPTEGSAEGPGG